jgi:hypothetical protein
MRAKMIFIRKNDNRIYTFEETNSYWVNIAINNDLKVFFTDKKTKYRKMVFNAHIKDISNFNIER